VFFFSFFFAFSSCSGFKRWAMPNANRCCPVGTSLSLIFVSYFSYFFFSSSLSVPSLLCAFVVKKMAKKATVPQE